VRDDLMDILPGPAQFYEALRERSWADKAVATTQSSGPGVMAT